MRRPLAAAALLAALLAAGCTTDRSTTGGAAATPAAEPTATGGGSTSAPAAGAASAGAPPDGDAALSGNTGAICDQAAKTGADFAATFAANVKLQIEAASAREPGALQEVERKAARDVQNYSFALNDMSKLAADPALKKALADMGKQVTALNGDVRKIDEKQLAALRTRLDEVCGSK
jgi:hypothetical protein